MKFGNILTLYLCVSVALYIGSAAMGAPLETSDTIANLIGVSGTGENTTIMMSEELNKTINQTTLEKGTISTTLGGVWDRISMVWGWILLMFDIVFVPVALCVAMQAPWPITMIIAILPILFIANLFAFIVGRQI